MTIGTVTLIHTQFNTEVCIYLSQIYAITTAPTMNSTVVIGAGGAAVPVLGSIEEVKNEVYKATVQTMTAITAANNKGE